MNSEGVAPLFDAVIDLVNSAGIAGVPVEEPEFSYEPAWRLWLGYEFAGGFGVRTRYFQFDHTASATTVFPAGTGVSPLNFAYGLETHVFDLELTDALRLGDKWDLLLSAGYRYVEYRENNVANITALGAPITLATGFESQSYGMTIGGELRRALGQRFALFGSARGSVLFGKEDEVFVVGLTIPGLVAGSLDLTEREDDNVKSILEFQVGGQWEYEFGNGSLLFVRGSVESQIWDNFSGTPILSSSASTGFFGFGIGLGLSR